jgi:hypothetical protein
LAELFIEKEVLNPGRQVIPNPLLKVARLVADTATEGYAARLSYTLAREKYLPPKGAEIGVNQTLGEINRMR